MKKINFRHVLFNELSNLALYQLLKLRVDIFVVEQNCVYPDLDNKDIDKQTVHVLMFSGEVMVGYARVLAPHMSYENTSIGRVAVMPDYRKNGMAKMLMQEAISVSFMHFNHGDIEIGAQCYLQSFYESLGFVATSDAYDEDGIMHLDMKLRYSSSINTTDKVD